MSAYASKICSLPLGKSHADGSDNQKSILAWYKGRGGVNDHWQTCGAWRVSGIIFFLFSSTYSLFTQKIIMKRTITAFSMLLVNLGPRRKNWVQKHVRRAHQQLKRDIALSGIFPLLPQNLQDLLHSSKWPMELGFNRQKHLDEFLSKMYFYGRITKPEEFLHQTYLQYSKTTCTFPF